ncbi:MAG: hypothetical protein WA628_18285 [Terriglobales bacterium]
MKMIIFSVLRSSLEKSTPLPFPETLKGVDDLIRISLEGFRDSCFNWLLIATFLVVVGLVFEGPELWHETTSIASHLRFRRRFRFSLPEEQAPNWAKLLAFIGWTLIVVGVAGEFVADSFVSRADGFVQKFDEILLADAQHQTELAKERAGGAYERASTAEKEAAQLRKDAESERLARIEIEQSLAARTLTDGDRANLRIHLYRFRGQEAGLCYNAGDFEGESFAWDIAKALDGAQWNVFVPSMVLSSYSAAIPFKSVTSGLETGIEVETTQNGKTRAIATELVRDFMMLGFDAHISSGEEKGPGPFIWVNVKTRPRGRQGSAKLKLQAQNK